MNNARINTKFSGGVHRSIIFGYLIMSSPGIALGPSNHKVMGAISALFRANALLNASYLS